MTSTGTSRLLELDDSGIQALRQLFDLGRRGKDQSGPLILDLQGTVANSNHLTYRQDDGLASGLPLEELLGFQARACFLVAPAALDKTVQGVVLLLQGLRLPGDGLSGAFQLVDGVPDLLVRERRGGGKVSGSGQLVSDARLLEGGEPGESISD